MIPFIELRYPLPGWQLDRVLRRRSILLTEDHWDVAFIRERDGRIVSSINTSLPAAWNTAMTAAQEADALCGPS